MRVLNLESHEYVANEKVGGGGSRSSISSDKQSADQKYILLLKVTFQEIPLIGTWIMNLQEGWKLRNIWEKTATNILNAL